MNTPKVVGQPCPDCQVPYIQGKTGAYCKPCYIKWANANKPQQQTSTRDFDAEARGKVRHGIVCAMLQAGKSYEDITPNLMRFEELIMGQPKAPAAPAPTEELPTIEVGAEDIPF